MAHSVEAYRDGELAGGLYGVSLGGAFMGESMFSRITDASKVCLVHLVRRLRGRGASCCSTARYRTITSPGWAPSSYPNTSTSAASTARCAYPGTLRVTRRKTVISGSEPINAAC